MKYAGKELFQRYKLQSPLTFPTISDGYLFPALRQITNDKNGARVYTQADFDWTIDPATRKFKSQLVTGVNRLVRENSRCGSVDTGTLMKSDQRSKPGKPIFFITCTSQAVPFNVFFTPAEAVDVKSSSFTAKANIDQSTAVDECRQAAQRAATNPSTVHFSPFMDVSFIPYPNGRSRLVSSFTAKNAFNAESKYRIECFFEGGTLTEKDISQAAD